MKQKTKTMILGNNAKSAEKELKDLGVEYDAEALKIDKEVASYVHLYLLISKVHNANTKSYTTTLRRHQIGNAASFARQITKGGLTGRYDNIILVHNANKQEDNGK